MFTFCDVGNGVVSRFVVIVSPTVGVAENGFWSSALQDPLCCELEPGTFLLSALGQILCLSSREGVQARVR